MGVSFLHSSIFGLYNCSNLVGENLAVLRKLKNVLLIMKIQDNIKIFLLFLLFCPFYHFPLWPFFNFKCANNLFPCLTYWASTEGVEFDCCFAGPDAGGFCALLLPSHRRALRQATTGLEHRRKTPEQVPTCSEHRRKTPEQVSTCSEHRQKTP